MYEDDWDENDFPLEDNKSVIDQIRADERHKEYLSGLRANEEPEEIPPAVLVDGATTFPICPHCGEGNHVEDDYACNGDKLTVACAHCYSDYRVAVVFFYKVLT